jgi:prepilin-type N-terminal cleavage/methylation domain-containing protein
MNNKQDKGFTLVELLIVIVILGILATVTVFAVRGITDQGQTSACQADEKTLQVALEAYYAQEGNEAGDVATETDLIATGLLVGYSNNYNVVDGAVVAEDQAAVAAADADADAGRVAVPAAVAADSDCIPAT